MTADPYPTVFERHLGIRITTQIIEPFQPSEMHGEIDWPIGQRKIGDYTTGNIAEAHDV